MYRLHSALVLLSLSIAGLGLPVARAQDSPELSRIIDGMEQVQRQNRAHCHAYTVTREYRFYDSGQQDSKSEVLAEIRFVPPNQKTFTIEHYEGSSRSQKIVQHILESEAQAARRDPPALDRRSYEFQLAGEENVDGRPSWVLQLKPLREDQQLVHGRAWVDKESYQIHRVEGDMARTPSWWLKKLHITLNYGGENGVWVPVDTRAVVDVRFFGTQIVTAEAVKILADDNVPSSTAQQGYDHELPAQSATPALHGRFRRIHLKVKQQLRVAGCELCARKLLVTTRNCITLTYL